ncbi:hypothetical protein SAMN06893096_104201 [Geodermatophilus pulveris]|uniref:Uncharacterized protein n=1 Tax=Geodermatophilus pulveris TaxID=1564159 RepID=A0A239EPD1_9ACTN|nr:hypothetical protein [Geodermatophilus pulveris]SNS45724.1 hypothetical protein SAMN06893096_104201 [Geodermatophilus pulveris]
MLLDDPGPRTPDPTGPPPALSDPVPRWCRVLGGAGAVVIPAYVLPVALLGALVTPAWVVLLTGPVLGLFVAAVVLTVAHPEPDVPGTRRAAAGAGAGAVLLVPFTAGLGLLGATGLGLTVVVLALAPFVVADRVCRPGDDLGRVLEQASALPTGRLLDAWRSTGEVLRGRPTARDLARVARLRAVLIDELAGRDPAGVEAWLRSGDDRPDRHVRGHVTG